jgi:hypothetical protein
VVRKDCTEWLAEVDKAQPSLILVAKTSDGHDAADASIFLDGELVPSTSESRALPVDPGRHQVTIVGADGSRVEETVVLREGEQQRRVAFTLPASPRAPGGAPASPSSGPSPWAWAASGVAVASLGTFAVMGLVGRGEVSELRATCAPSCDPSAVDSARTKLIVADVALATGVVAAGVATWLFFAPRGREAPRSAAVHWSVAPGPHGAAAHVGGSF